MAAIGSFARSHPGLTYYALVFLISWGLYERTESLLLAMLMHASSSASMLILQPPVLGLRAGLTWNLVLAALLWATVGAVAIAGRRHLSRPTRRPSLQEAPS